MPSGKWHCMCVFLQDNHKCPYGKYDFQMISTSTSAGRGLQHPRLSGKPTKTSVDKSEFTNMRVSAYAALAVALFLVRLRIHEIIEPFSKRMWGHCEMVYVLRRKKQSSIELLKLARNLFQIVCTVCLATQNAEKKNSQALNCSSWPETYFR